MRQGKGRRTRLPRWWRQRGVPPMWPLQRRHYRRLSADPDAGPVTHDVRVLRDVRVPMRDGTVLMADLWLPVAREADLADGAGAGSRAGKPVVLIRCPYGRRGLAPDLAMFAERGHPVLIQSCRGTFGSGVGPPDATTAAGAGGSPGDFAPFRHEETDGLDTVRWIEAQDWFTGRIHTYGFSYFGLTQWALTRDLPASVEAMTIAVSARSFRDAIVHPGGGFGIETAVCWARGLARQEGRLWRRLSGLVADRTAIPAACDTIPPGEAVEVAIGAPFAPYRDWLSHPADSPWWDPLQFGQDPAAVPALVLVGGWYDLFCADQVADFVSLSAAGRPVRLVMGPWTHAQPEPGIASMGEALAQLRDVTGAHARPPVRVQPIGSDAWLEFAQWPPPTAPVTRWLGDVGGLDAAPTAGSREVGYRYDPADPTPMCGGRGLNVFTSGRRDQGPRERRPDVLCWTGEPLDADLLLVGDPRVHLVMASTQPRPDLFVRLCEVDAAGVSWNLTDGFVRLAPLGDGSPAIAAGEDGQSIVGDDAGWRRVDLTLSPVAALVRAGHRLRLQVSSGAHPLYLRNPGTSDPLHDFSTLIPGDVTFVVGGAGPDAARIDLPVLGP